MNHFEAHKILDQVLEGVNYPEQIINIALVLTGDLDEHKLKGMAANNGGAGMDCQTWAQSSNAGTPRSSAMVA